MAVPSILDSIGGDIVGVMLPVSACMLAVVLLVSSLTATTTTTSPVRTVASLVYLESTSDSASTKLEGALLNAVVVVALIAAVTFVVVVLYYLNFTSFLSAYLRFSVFTVLASMGGSFFLALIHRFSVTVDAATCLVLLFNFTVVGVVSVFSDAVPIFLRQSYTVSLGVFVAATLTRLPEWSTWVLLGALAVYDVAAVLIPGGPLKLLIEIASRRGGELPALVYEARPRARENSDDPGSVELQAARGDREVPPLVRASGSDASPENQDASEIRAGDHGYIVQEMPPPVTNLRGRASGSDASPESQDASEIRVRDHGYIVQEVPLSVANSRGRASGNDASELRVEDDTSPLVGAEAEREAMQVTRPNAEDTETFETRGIQLGLGDFIFYSVLVGRAAMYDLMTVYACYLAIISGLGCTLVLLSICRRALPALPISITLGIVFYFLTRLLMEPFVVGVVTNLMMF